jgi:hypothetical protein
MIFRLFTKRRRAQLSKERWHALATAAEAEADRANAELERRLRRGETRRWPETPAADPPAERSPEGHPHAHPHGKPGE